MQNKKEKQMSNRLSKQTLVSNRSSRYSYQTDRQDNRAVNRRDDTKPKVPLKGRHKWQPLRVFVLLIIILFICYGITLKRTPQIDLSNYDNNSSIRPLNIYKQAIQKEFNASLLNYTKLTINAEQISNNLKNQFPELSQVYVSIPLIGHQPTVTLTLSQPFLIAQSPINNLVFEVSSSGIAIRKITSSSLNTIKLPKLTMTIPDSSVPGTTILATSDINFITLLIAESRVQHLTIQSLNIPQQTRELDVQFSGIAYFVKFNMADNDNVRNQIGDFLSVKQYLQSKGITPSQYIDSRIAGRVYYK